jgi:lipopolysaccharide transport protein LptA
VVTDPDMKLTADRLVVRFSEDGQAEAIEAKGNVRITQMDKIAEADVATYTVEDGRIALEGNPKVHRGKDRLEGDTIVFWRDQNKMICEPHARLVIFPEKGGARDQLFGE